MRETRKEAKTHGDTYYFTGEPCCHGHISKRLTCSGNCCECYKTTHREKRLERANREEIIKSKMHIRDLRNNESIKAAKNHKQQWTLEDIEIACRLIHGSDQYAYTAPELSKMLGRSNRAIQRVRGRISNQ